MAVLQTASVKEEMALLAAGLGAWGPEQVGQVQALVSAELNEAVLSWEGPTDVKPFGYGIRLPSVHILYSNEDDANHAHSLFRILGDDYGASLD